MAAANSILRSYYENLPTVSQTWAARWFSRHPKYKKKTRKSLSVVRINTHDIEDLDKWFKKLKAVREKYGIVDQDIYNINEIGFRIKVSRQHKVIVKVSNTSRYLADLNNRDYITSIESITTNDITHALMLILKASSLLEKWVVNELHDDTALIYNEIGYLNNEINLA